MKKKKLMFTVLLSLFLCFLFIALLIVSQLAVLQFVPSVKAQESSFPSIVWREFPYLPPKLINLTDAYVYQTDWGNYTFIKGKLLNVMMYVDRSGEVSALNSTFWIKASTPLIFPFNPVIITANDTYFEVKIEVRFGTSIVGYLTQKFNFNRTDLPKISVTFEKTASWAYGDFQIYWILGSGWGSNAYVELENGTLTTVSGPENVLGNFSKCWLTVNNVTRKLFVTWEDEGIAILGKGTLKASDVSVTGVIIYFNLNDDKIDPSFLGTTSASTATQHPFQRKTFYANGRFWVFYSDGINMVYKTSTDGATWMAATPVRAAYNGYEFSIWFDGTYLHYAYARASSIYYLRGTPSADGTITWSAVEQTVSTTYNSAYYPFVSVDSNGYVWIGYQEYTGTYFYPYVIKSQFNNGTWGTTPTGFPYQLSTVSSSDWIVSPIPLTNAKMLVIYARGSYPVYVKRWDGAAWGTEVATTNAIRGGTYCSAVAQGDDVHLTFLKSVTYDILYTKYVYATNNFSAETTLVTGATIYSAPVISRDPATNDLYVFAATKTTGTPAGWTANHIYYVKYTVATGTWGSWVDWINESTEVLTAEDKLTCFYQAYGGYIGLAYMNKTASPYNVKFAFLQLSTPPTIGGFQAPSTVYANKYFLLNATINDADGIGDFVNATIEINGSIVLKWVNTTLETYHFSIYSDPNGYCTLDAANSLQTSLNTTAYRLSWKIKLTWTYPEGSISVISTNTKVYDSAGAGGSGSQSGLFTFEDDLIIHTDAAVSDSRVNPGQSITFTASIYYQGTTMAPEDVAGIIGRVELNGVLKGSDTDVTGGLSITITAENSVANYSYNIYCVTDENSVQNQTVYVVVDRGVITISANTTSPAPNGHVSFTLTAMYDFDHTQITSWTVNTLRNGTHYATGNFTDGGYTDTLYIYTVENMTENTYGLTAFTSNTFTVCWSTYVALTVKTVDLDGDILTEAIVYFNETSAPVDSSGLATKTGIVKNNNVTVKVNWQGVWVNGSWTVNMTDTKTIEAPCQVWQIAVNARDNSGTMLSLSPTMLAWTFPNGTQVNTTKSDGSWSFKLMNGTHYYHIQYQGQWVSENVTLPVANKNVTVINKNCWVYSLTVYVTDVNSLEKSGATLTLARTDNASLSDYGLTPKTAGYYNSTHARYVWSQLANQTSSYTVTAEFGGQTASTTTSLTANTEIVLTLPAGTQSSSGGSTPPSEQPPAELPPVELPKVPGAEFNYGIMVLVGIVGVAVVVGIAGRGKPSLEREWRKKTSFSSDLNRKWRKKARRK